MRTSLGLASPVLLTLLAGAITAQTTQHSLTIGGNGALGCNANDPPRLSDGSLASGVFDFDYDPATNILTLVVTNTSEVQENAFNPLLTAVSFSLPEGAVDDVQLLSQSPTGPLLPIFRLDLDLDQVTPPNLTAGCLGNFNVRLMAVLNLGGVGNADARRFLFPPPAVIEGPITFRLKLSGPAVDLLDARRLARGFSQETATQVHAAFEYKWAGSHGIGRGVVSEQPDPDDNDGSIWSNDPPRIGDRIDLCFRGPAGVHACVFGSFNPVPVTIGPYEVPIGLPITLTLLLPPFPANNIICRTVRVPDDVNLVGLRFYLTMAMASDEEFVRVLFTPRVNLSFLE